MNNPPLPKKESQGIATGSENGDELPVESEVGTHPTPPPFPGSYTENLLPWYFQKVWIIIVALNVPPLALPMIIAHPKFSLRAKIGYSLLIPLLMWILWISVVKTWDAVQNLIETLQTMGV